MTLDIRVQDIDHCGIVAGICDEMNLVEEINRLLGTHSQEIISAGQKLHLMTAQCLDIELHQIVVNMVVYDSPG
ncbi:MAG: DUF4277 domain-containing protein [Nostoc sp.]|uniref:DUF4277 domain-containing protein n=1 Tax=Nostoc sp. TaxID=1180 RepID=UPI002FFA7617